MWENSSENTVQANKCEQQQNFQETKPKYKTLHTKISKNNHSQQAQRESKLFYPLISILLLLTLVRKKHSWEKIWCNAPQPYGIY